MNFFKYCSENNCFNCEFSHIAKYHKCEKEFEAIKRVQQVQGQTRRKEQMELEKNRQFEMVLNKLELELKASHNALNEQAEEMELLEAENEKLKKDNFRLLELESSLLNSNMKLIEMMFILMKENKALKVKHEKLLQAVEGIEIK